MENRLPILPMPTCPCFEKPRKWDILKLGKTNYDEVSEMFHWGDMKDSINNGSTTTLNDLKGIYPNEDVHVAVMFGTNEDHIYLTSLDGTIVYDVFAN